MSITFSAVGTAGDSVTDQNQVTVPVAGTPASGNFLLIHVANQHGENTWATPSGWTAIGSQVTGAAAFYKIAAGGETDVTVTKTGSIGRCFGRMMLFTQDTGGTLSLDASQTDVDLTLPTVTPTKENTLWVWLANSRNFVGSDTFDSYAMATDNPTWTERYEQSATAGQVAIAAATSTIRSQTSATGNLTATNTAGGNLGGIVIAIGQALTSNFTPDPVGMTSALPALTFIIGINLSISALSMTATPTSPTILTTSPPSFSDLPKNSVSPSNTSKNAASPSNISKTSSTFNNTNKTQ